MTVEELIGDFLNPPNAYQSLSVERVCLSLILTFYDHFIHFFMFTEKPSKE